VCGTLTALEVVGKPARERLVAGQGSITLPARRRGHGPRHNISDAVPKCAFMGNHMVWPQNVYSITLPGLTAHTLWSVVLQQVKSKMSEQFFLNFA
jgi:hypothetical protein